MILEYGSTIIYSVHIGFLMVMMSIQTLYKIAPHKNHPSTIWTRSSSQHYDWLFRLFRMLSTEYSIRYSNGVFKVHKSWEKLGKLLETAQKYQG